MAVNNTICRIEIKERDLSTRALRKFYQNLDKHNVTVGIHRDTGSKQIGNNGFTLIKNACIQEFGNTQTVKKTRRFKSPMTGKWFVIKKGTELNIPPRIFVRIFNDKKEKKDLTEAFKNQIEVYPKKGDAIAVYDGVGYLAKWKMRNRITGHKIRPKNAEMTKEYKGSNTPLYMTGGLYFGIESRVN